MAEVCAHPVCRRDLPPEVDSDAPRGSHLLQFITQTVVVSLLAVMQKATGGGKKLERLACRNQPGNDVPDSPPGCDNRHAAEALKKIENQNQAQA